MNTFDSWRYIEVLRSETIGLCRKLNIVYSIFYLLSIASGKRSGVMSESFFWTGSFWLSSWTSSPNQTETSETVHGSSSKDLQVTQSKLTFGLPENPSDSTWANIPVYMILWCWFFQLIQWFGYFNSHCTEETILTWTEDWWGGDMRMCEPTQQAQNRHTTSYDVDIWLNFGCDVGWPKSNVNPTSNVNVKLMSNTDVSWRWDLVVFRLCNQNPTLSQHQIDVKYWRQPDFHFQPKCNVCLTSCPTSTWRYIDVWCLLGSTWMEGLNESSYGFSLFM